MPTSSRRPTAVGAALLLAGAALLGSGLATASGASGYAPVQLTNIDRPVPAGATLLPHGRLVTPAGESLFQGDFPLAVAVSPDGTTAVATGVGQGDGTPQGDFEDKCVDGQRQGSCGYGPIGQGDPPAATPDEALFVTNLTTGAVTAVRGPLTQCDPGSTTATFACFEDGVTFSPDGQHVYASGGGNDAVYDFPVTPSSTGDAVGQPSRVAYLQELNGAPASSSTYQHPTAGTAAARTKGLAVSADGRYLFVVKEQAGVLDILRTSDLSLVQEVPFAGLNPTGANGSVTYPHTVVVEPDLSAAWVTLQGVAAVARVPLTTDPVTGALTALAPVAVPVGAAPTGEALSPDGHTLLVTDANDDTVKVVDTDVQAAAAPVVQTLVAQAIPGSQHGSTPDAVAFAPGRDDLAYVALAGDDAVAQLALGSGGWSVAGTIPTGWYPTGVAVRPDGDLLALAAKGLGEQYPAIGGYSRPPIAGGPQALDPGYYDASAMAGLLTLVPARTPDELASDSATVRADIEWAATQEAAPTGSPIPSVPGGATPITHVVYIVRENRTYDQEYGDLATTRNDADADPAFQSLASATPAGHALVGRFASSDSFFSDGEASVQGHWWTSSANVDDYVEKSWRQYYSSRNHSNDEISAPTSFPANCSLFQSALAKQASDPAFTWKDFGEPVGVANPSITGSIPGQGQAGTLPNPCAAVPAASVDLLPFSSFEGIDDRTFVDSTFTRGLPGGTTDPDAFLQASGINPDGSDAGNGQSLRNFSYVELPGDHTTGFTAQGASNVDGHTPRAQIAENDAALGEVVSALSHSRYWSSTAVFVVEDDSQDGPDHVDGHRNVLLVASPYAKQASANGCYGGYISHVHSDQAAVVRTVEDILGLPQLSSYDQYASPLYDLFQAKDSAAQLSGADLAPWTAPAPAPFVDEKVGDPSAGSPALQAALRQESSHLDLSAPDRAGPVLEDVLWRSTTSRVQPAELSERVTTWELASTSGASDATAAALVAASEPSAAPGATQVPADLAAPAAAGSSGGACAPTVGPGTPPAGVPETGRPALLGGLGVLLLLGGTGVLGRRRLRRG